MTRRTSRGVLSSIPAVPRSSSAADFTGPGFRQIYQWMPPGLKGLEKKHRFNEPNRGIVLAAGVGGATLGLVCFGRIGAVLGLGAGIAAGGSFVASRQLYRDRSTTLS